MTCEKSSKDSAKITASFLKQGKIVIMPTDTVYGFSGIATKVEITHTLRKQVYGYWSDVETWSGTYYTWYGILTSSRSNLGAGMFRLKTVAKVYSGSNYETITVYSDQVSSVG